MTHQEFVTGYREGTLKVHVDPKAAAQLVSRQMMLPLVMLPFFGIAVALALVGYFIAGAVVFVLALGFRYFVRRTSTGFILRRALGDPRFYQEVVAASILAVQDA
ncbi:MAG TPA: hypothetical protein VGI18_00575 [Burkholderiales bacterium]